MLCGRVDPEKADEDFKIVSLPLKADGTPDLENIVYDPPEARWRVPGVRAVLKGAERLEGPWTEVPVGDGSPHLGRLAPPCGSSRWLWSCRSGARALPEPPRWRLSQSIAD